MPKISLESLDFEYRKILAFQHTANHAHEHFKQYPGEDWENPYNDVQRTAKSMMKGLKKDIEHYLVRLYNKKFCSNLDLGNCISGYEEWFTVENFSCAAFVQRIHDTVAGDVDRLTLGRYLKGAEELIRDVAGIKEEEKDKLIESKTLTINGWSEEHFEKERILSDHTLSGLHSLLWVSAFVSQVPLEAEPPSDFDLSPFSYWFQNTFYWHKPLPIDREFPAGPWKRIVCFKNGKVVIHYRTGLKETLDAVFFKKVSLVYQNTDVDLNSVFEQETGEIKRVVRMR